MKCKKEKRIESENFIFDGKIIFLTIKKLIFLFIKLEYTLLT